MSFFFVARSEFSPDAVLLAVESMLKSGPIKAQNRGEEEINITWTGEN